MNDAPSAPACQLLLASGSPRRADLLGQIGVSFRALVADVDESLRARESAEDYVDRLARAKAETGRASQGESAGLPCLGADTAVVIGRDILGKPRDRQDYLDMLSRLSGRSHEVWSGVALADAQGVRSRVNSSKVQFRMLEAAEIAAYWETGEPVDKAGGYAIQGLAAVFVRSIQGSYSGIMGLPLFETAELLKSAGIRVPRMP